MIDIDQLTEKSLEFTEKLINHVSTSSGVPKSSFMELRAHIFPKVMTYLAEGNYFHTNTSVLSTLVDQLPQQSLLIPQNGYVFSQQDVNDGFTTYVKTEEFKGIASSLRWGRDYNRTIQQYVPIQPNAALAAQELYKMVIAQLQGEKIKPQALGNLEPADTRHNNAIFAYHAQRLVKILRQQPGTFAVNASGKATPHATEDKSVEDEEQQESAPAATNPENGESLADPSSLVSPLQPIVDHIDEVLQEARAYRDLVHSVKVSSATSMPLDGSEEQERADPPQKARKP